MPNSHRERGSISIYVVTISAAMILLLGLVVDLGGQIRARQYAEAVASEAARAAGQQIDPLPALQGQSVSIQAGQAELVGRKYIANAGLTGTVTATDTAIRVTTHTTYQAKILSIIGITSFPANGSAEARLTEQAETFEGTGIEPTTNPENRR
ncbi:pilus assembly protein TadG-related protein [Kribbia dieselivorans]|uniref:pilus assembly protein TadG-related protein n=1 Tax=Kribbia dieselivorans TaxID=331526 RepID=UPI000838A3B6|nr:pilus assembly protein TadG-related protein [Kribbia dieselivorans]